MTIRPAHIFMMIRFFSQRLGTIEGKIDELLMKENLIMSQLDDLNAAMAAEDVEVETLIASAAKIDADVTALLAKVKAGGATMPDITTQLSAIQKHTASLAKVDAEMVSDDTAANA